MEVYIRRFTSEENFIVDYYNKNKSYVKKSVKALKSFFGGKLPNGDLSEALLIGWGYSKPENGGDPDFNKLEPIYLDEEARKRNVLGFGSIGTGKTYLALAILHNDVLMGKPVVFIDPKPSLDTLNVFVYAALESDRIHDFRLVSMFYPEVSYCFNPLSRYFIPDEIISHLTSGIFVKDQFFIDVSVELTAAVILMLYLKAVVNKGTMDVKIGDIVRYTHQKEFTKIYDEFGELQKVMRSQYPQLLGYFRSLESIGDKIKDSPKDYFSKVTTTLRVHLAQLSIGVAGKLLSGDHNFVGSIEAGDSPIVLIQLSGLIDPRVTKKISRVIASMIRTLAGRLLIKRKRLPRPVSFVIDEFSNALHLGFEEGVNKAREAGIQYTVFTQTVSDLYKEVGETYAGVILGNFNTIISFSSPDLETSKYVATRFGTHRTYELIVRNFEEPTYRAVEKPVIDPGMVMDIPPRHFYFKDYRNIAYGLTSDYYVPNIEIDADVPLGIKP